MADQRDSDIFTPGEVLNNTYVVEGVVGRGGLGEVYRVRNNVTGRIFAIKALNAQFSGKDDYVELMKREEEMRLIIHESVVRYNECSRTDNGNVILVMDYVPGPSLAQVMAERQLSEKDLLIIAHRIAQGLEAAHAHGIVHRDLSPDNIILRDGQADQAVLIDFGIAKDTSEGARTIVGNDFAGKYEYAAPEQVEGRAEPKSDLYGLGATLLAAYRGETPFLGTTPGEIVRRKQAPLELSGVPDKLRRLIETVSAPDPGDRPRDATAAVALIERLLDIRSAREAPAKAQAAGGRNRGENAGGRRGRMPLIIGLVAVGLAGLAFGLSLFFKPSLPLVAPYTLFAGKAVSGRTMMEAHAPDQETAARLVDAFAEVTGAPRAAAEVTLAEGMPEPAWAQNMIALIALLDAPSRWELTVSDRVASVTGLVEGPAQHAALLEDLKAWQDASGMVLDHAVLVGPERLSASDLDQVLREVQTCGALEVEGGPFALGDNVRVRGNVAAAADGAAIARALEAKVGSRKVVVDVKELNPDICAIRDVLPVPGDGNVSIRFFNGADNAPNLTGVFHTGENPVVDIQLPLTEAADFIWVMVVDNTGQVIHVLPNIAEPEMRLENLGVVDGGLRRIPVLYPKSILAEDPKKLVVEIISGSYGKSEIVAILSRESLFDGLRPRIESTTSLKEALTEALARRESDIVAIASRIIEARQ